MACKKCSNRMRTMLAQFFYECRLQDNPFCKIRKNADELGKLLDSMDGEKENKKEK